MGKSANMCAKLPNNAFEERLKSEFFDKISIFQLAEKNFTKAAIRK